MAFGGPNLARGKDDGTQGTGVWNLLRVMRYARAYRRILIPAILCVVMVALTYSVNLVALLPFIHVIADERPIPAWVHGWVAEHRLGAVLDAQGLVVEVDPVVGAAEGLKKRDRLMQLDHEGNSADDAYKRLAELPNGQAALLTVERTSEAGAKIRVDVPAKPRDQGWRQRLALWGAQFLPTTLNRKARMTSLIIIIVLGLLIALVGAVCRFLGEYLIAMVSARTVVGMRRQMYRTVLRLPLTNFSHTSDIISRFVQDSQEIYRGLNFVFAKSLREPLKAAFVFTAALFVDWRITLVTVTAAPFAALIIRKLGKTVRKSNKRLLLGYSKMLTALEGALVGIRVVKGYNMEGYERRHLYAVDQDMLKQELKLARIEALTSPAFETIGRIIASVVMIYFADQMFSGRMTFARFGALAGLMAAMFDPIRQMSGFYNRMQRASAAADRCFELMSRPMEEGTAAVHRELPTVRESIEFHGLSYTYPGSEQPALDGIDLVVRRGERVAVVGPNGSGKTTLLSILMRFIEPDGGTLRFDGRDVRECSIGSLRRQMSLVTQDTVIFPDTIAVNVAYGDETILRRMMLQRRHPKRRYDLTRERARIEEASRAAFADEFIREKPEGYDTELGEHGTTLSGGQKQRLAIARAILRNAPIFIFDEATSQVDSESERKIHDAVERFLEGRTAFIIAHRFSTIMQADRIVVMERGRIVDVGRHAELKQRCAQYQALYGTQIIDDTAPVREARVASASA